LKIVFIVGTRPQIIKSVLLIHYLYRDSEVNFIFVHTGQHYDYEMSRVFFEELGLPDPHYNLSVGSGSHAWQTAMIMLRLEEVLAREEPDLVVVPGDTNSTLAGALTAVKMGIPVAHVEAGARSYDMGMPEEVNRRVVDHISSILFTPTRNCTRNLLNEGIGREKIFEVGDTMYDVLLHQLPKVDKSEILHQLSLKPREYIFLTVHRQENVDSFESLANIVRALSELREFTIVFPVHPRTRKRLEEFNLLSKLEVLSHVKIISPVGYIESLALIKNARLVLTDSGGIQKEAFWLKTPCITLRENTEWIETIEIGANRLVGTDPIKIVSAVREILERELEIRIRIERAINPFGDGRASERIVKIIKEFLATYTNTN